MKVFVTGASGFLGAEICRQLIEAGHEVVANGRDLPRLEKTPCSFVLPGDLLEMDLNRALRGVEVIIHSAALSSPWGRAAEFEAANVTATRRLVEEANQNGVCRFVQISTPAVYYNETNRYNLSEDSPLAVRPANHYVRTKLEAERLVLSSIPAIVLRPRAIFGPGDRTLFPRLAKAAKDGRLRIFGNGRTICDLTVVQNAAFAAVCAAGADSSCLGKVYNITNGEPVNLWNLIDRILLGCGYRPPTRRIPKPIALSLASFIEAAAGWFGGKEPWITRYSAGLLICSQTFDISRACAELGYHPKVTIDEGVEAFIQWYRSNEG